MYCMATVSFSQYLFLPTLSEKYNLMDNHCLLVSELALCMLYKWKTAKTVLSRQFNRANHIFRETLIALSQQKNRDTDTSESDKHTHMGVVGVHQSNWIIEYPSRTKQNTCLALYSTSMQQMYRQPKSPPLWRELLFCVQTHRGAKPHLHSENTFKLYQLTALFIGSHILV